MLGGIEARVEPTLEKAPPPNPEPFEPAAGAAIAAKGASEPARAAFGGMLSWLFQLSPGKPLRADGSCQAGATSGRSVKLASYTLLDLV